MNTAQGCGRISRKGRSEMQRKVPRMQGTMQKNPAEILKYFEDDFFTL